MYFCISASLFPAKKSVTVFDTVAVAVSGNTMASRLIFISFAIFILFIIVLFRCCVHQAEMYSDSIKNEGVILEVFAGLDVILILICPVQLTSASYSPGTSFAAGRYALCGILLLCRTAAGWSGGQRLRRSWGRSRRRAPSVFLRRLFPV